MRGKTLKKWADVFHHHEQRNQLLLFGQPFKAAIVLSEMRFFHDALSRERAALDCRWPNRK